MHRNKFLSFLLGMVAVFAVGSGSIHPAEAYSTLDINSIPKFVIPKSGSQNIINHSIELEMDSIPTGTAPLFKAKVDIAKETQTIQEMLNLDHNIEIGSLREPSAISRNEFVGLDKSSGRWFYQTDLAYDTGENVPDEKSAIQIAINHIQEYDIFPADKLGEPRTSELTSGDGIAEPEKVLRRDIIFHPTVDGYEVNGVYRICISIGSNGDIVAVEKLASEYERVGDVPLKSESDIENDIVDGNYSLSDAHYRNNLIATDIDINMYADPESEYIQPVFSITNNDGDMNILVDAMRR